MTKSPGGSRAVPARRIAQRATVALFLLAAVFTRTDTIASPSTPKVPSYEIGEAPTTTSTVFGTPTTINTAEPAGSSTTSSTAPAAPSVSTDEDHTGITNTTIKLCAYEPFLLGSTFGLDPGNQDVYWRMVNDTTGPDGKPGIRGRRVEMTFKDDQSSNSGAVVAAEGCVQAGAFAMMSGGGIDQTIPVRTFAEKRRIPFFYTTATELGLESLRYSFGFLPSSEFISRRIGEYAAAHYPTRRHGIVYVNTPTWTGGRLTYLDELTKAGIKPAFDQPLSSSNGLYVNQVLELKRAGVEVLYLHANFVEWFRFVNQATEQDYHPLFLGEFPTSTILRSIGSAIDGRSGYPAAQMISVIPNYSPADASLPQHAEIERMQVAYAKYLHKKPNDLDWNFWLGFRALHQVLYDCGPNCTRSKLIGMLESGYHPAIPPLCELNFATFPAYRGHLGGAQVNLEQAGYDPEHGSYWRQLTSCASRF